MFLQYASIQNVGGASADYCTQQDRTTPQNVFSLIITAIARMGFNVVQCCTKDKLSRVQSCLQVPDDVYCYLHDWLFQQPSSFPTVWQICGNDAGHTTAALHLIFYYFYFRVPQVMLQFFLSQCPRLSIAMMNSDCCGLPILQCIS